MKSKIDTYNTDYHCDNFKRQDLIDKVLEKEIYTPLLNRRSKNSSIKDASSISLSNSNMKLNTPLPQIQVEEQPNTTNTNKFHI